MDHDDVAMESSFAQQLKEEYVSTKIGNIYVVSIQSCNFIELIEHNYIFYRYYGRLRRYAYGGFGEKAKSTSKEKYKKVIIKLFINFY